MSKDQIQIVKNDLEYLLELAEKIEPDNCGAALSDLVNTMRNVCERDIRILGNMK